MFALLPGSSVPLYRQIVDQVKRLVAGGLLPPGAELPSVRDVALQHAINPMTVSKAYALLEAEGLLERQRGRPMRIAAGSAAFRVRLRQLEPIAEELVRAARQLSLGPDDVGQLLGATWKKMSSREGDHE